ncbi:MAG: hypothetical protein ACLR5O_01825 [Romboutsia timonensis]|uniref:hypothetical protein n=1 Tax=Romboutsia timonensis TaxID=1776391 RepID=UPI00399FF725
MNDFEIQQKEISDEEYLSSVMNKMMTLDTYVNVCTKAKEMNLSTKEMISFVNDFYGVPNICNHEVSFDCNVFEYTYSNGVKDGVKCRMCNHKMKLETFDLAVKLGLGNKIIDINKEEKSMKKYLVLGNLNDGSEGIMYCIINADNDLEAMKKVEKSLEDGHVNTDIISVMSPIEITDADQVNFVIPSGITKLED